MTQIERAPAIADGFDRILDFPCRHEVPDAPARIQEIPHGSAVPEYNPMVGRPARHDLRELIIGRQSRGCVALYRDVAESDTVLVLAVGSQREAADKIR